MSERYKATFIFGPPLPKPQGGVMQRWRRSQYRKEWHERVAALVISKKLKPPEPLTRVRMVCIRYSATTKGQIDYDNLVYSFKPIIDALVKCGIMVDDNMGVIVEREYRWIKAKRKDQRVTITIEEI